MKNLWKRYHKVLISYAILFTVQLMVYYFAKLVNMNRVHHDFTLAFDRKVPFYMIWIYPYIIAYAWWAITPFLIAHVLGDKAYKQFMITTAISFVICFLIFIIVPTTIARPTVEVNGITSWVTKFIFDADQPNNLLPSMHCLISWIAYMIFRNQKRAPKPLVYAQLIMAVLVCLSTQFIKQHYVVDIFSAIIIAEAVYYIVKKTRLDHILNKYHFIE